MTKTLCENALLHKQPLWDPDGSPYRESLIEIFGNAEAAMAHCMEKLGIGPTPIDTLVNSAKSANPALSLGDYSTKFWSQMWSESEITLIFAIIIVGYWLFAFTAGSRHWMSRNAVIILPTLGILGTFVGVHYALLNFDIQNLDASITEIIRGLQIAFTTSILGMVGGVSVRLFNSRAENQQSTKDEASADDIYDALLRIRGRDDAAAVKADLSDIHKALAGEGDASLSTLITKMRSDLNDFAKTVAEANTSALIDALKDVIKDFNEKMSEQFGENFKQLNVAVGRLLEWQENYKNDLDGLRVVMNEAVNSIEACRSSIERIAEASGTIPRNMEALEKVLSDTGDQLVALEERLGAFADMREKAQDAFPRIEELLNSYTDRLGNAVQDSMDTLKAGLEAQNNSMEGIQDGYSRLKGDIAEIGTELGDQVRDVLKESLDTINTSISSAHDAQKDHLETVYQNLENSVGNLEESYGQLRDDANEASKIAVEAVKASAEEQGRFIKEVHGGLEETYEKLRDDAKEVSEIVVKAVQTSAEEQARLTKDVHDRQIQGMRELDDAFGSLREQADISAKIVVDAIKNNQETLEDAGNAMAEAVDEIGPIIKDTLNTSMEDLTSSLDEFMREHETQSQDRLQKVTDGLNEFIRDHEKQSYQRLDNLTQELDNRAKDSAQSIEALAKEQLDVTRQSLEQSISNSMSLFDQYSGSIAEKFADDYRPVIEQLRRLMQLARDLETELSDRTPPNRNRS